MLYGPSRLARHEPQSLHPGHMTSSLGPMAACLAIGYMLSRPLSNLLFVASGWFPNAQTTQLGGEMMQPRRSRRPRSARVVSNALQRPSSRGADLPEVLEQSTLRRCDIRCSEEPALGQGTIVKLFSVSHQPTQSSGSPTRSVWIVQALDISDGILMESRGAKMEAIPRLAGKAIRPHKLRTSVKVRNTGTGRQALVAKGARKRSAIVQQETEGDIETDDASDEEGEAEEAASRTNDCDEEDEVIVRSTMKHQTATLAVGECRMPVKDCDDHESIDVVDKGSKSVEEAGDHQYSIHGDNGDRDDNGNSDDNDDDYDHDKDDNSHDENARGSKMHEIAKNIINEHNNSQKDENEQDTEEQDCGGRNMGSAEAQAEEVVKAVKDHDEYGQDLERSVKDAGEAEREGEGEDTGHGDNGNEAGQEIEEEEEEETHGDEPIGQEDEVAVGGMKKHENATRAIDEHHRTWNHCSRQTAKDHESNDVNVGVSEAVETTGNKVAGDNGDKDDADDRKDMPAEGEQANESDGGGQDRNEDIADEEERNRGKEAVGMCEGEDKGGRGRETERVEVSDMAHEHVTTEENGLTDKSVREGEMEGIESRKEGVEDLASVREAGEAEEQRAATEYYGEAPRSWHEGVVDSEMEDRADADPGETQKRTGNDDGSAEETRKRPFSRSEAFGSSTPGDRPHKRSKSDTGECEEGLVTNDVSKGTASSPTTPGPKTPSLKSTTPSPHSTIEVVRQTSVVPGWEGTESAVWDAAKRDSVISLLSLEQQTKMVHAALSLGSKEGIEALQFFVHNARREGRQRGKDIHSDPYADAPQSSMDVRHATSAMVFRNNSLSRFSDLYRQIDTLDNKVTLFSIDKRVKLAAMAQYRKSLVPEGAGRNKAKDANLHLFHSVYPDHATIKNLDDKRTSSAARCDWNRLCNRLREGRMWLEVSNVFGGAGAFLALPPQCVPDRHILRMPAKNFGSWLGLLQVAWRALDTHARQTLNELVRMSLARQPLPEEVLVLETLEYGSGTAPASLSNILTGWSPFRRNSLDGEGEPSTTKHCEEDGDRATLGPPSTTASTANRPQEDENSDFCSREMLNVDDGLLKDLDFDDGLSQEI